MKSCVVFLVEWFWRLCWLLHVFLLTRKLTQHWYSELAKSSWIPPNKKKYRTNVWLSDKPARLGKRWKLYQQYGCIGVWLT